MIQPQTCFKGVSRASALTIAVFALKIVNAVAALLAISAAAAPNAPPGNPYLADSSYPAPHFKSNVTPVAGPIAKSKRLSDNEVTWSGIGPVNGWTPNYSGPYPNGKRVIWVGGYDRVAKLDADSLEVLTTFALGGNTFFGHDEIERYIKTADNADKQTLIKYALKTWAKPQKARLQPTVC